MLPVNISSLLLADAEPAKLDLVALPRPVALSIFARLPVNTRLRCSEVCRGWRELLKDTSAWSNLLDLMYSSVDNATFSVPLFRAAVARAGGQLRKLRVAWRGGTDDLNSAATFEETRAAAAANAGSLKSLRVAGQLFKPHEIAAVLAAAPNLSHLFVNLRGGPACSIASVRSMLCNEPPYEPLKMQTVYVENAWESGVRGDADVAALSRDLARHETLAHVILCAAPLITAAAVNSIVNAAVKKRFASLVLIACQLNAQALPALTRLLVAGSGWLEDLKIQNAGFEMFEENDPRVRPFCDALRGASSLKTLVLDGGDNAAVEAAVASVAATRRRSA